MNDAMLWKSALASGVLLVIASVTGADGTALVGAALPVACVAWVRYDRRRHPRLEDESSRRARDGHGRRDVGGLSHAGQKLRREDRR
ncbi:hypothetical protein EFA46_007630 [Halarchaeum sp. CBA1220]|uniref:hypothetical protein n=1 Tax=Halarchaeum sp. CBA1220 TaxID=1853682 RepID=UPI000F3AA879|nr:hypothetical protein [Halarchaeum sp. CBA1220]QLC34079.1 hypothetical protein EFA46_007630 [Halarchaeum sp. CBA1220]